MINVLAVFILLITSCKLFDNSYKRKFGGIEHTFSNIEDMKRVEFLAKHIHKKKWKIVYGFGCDSPLCSKSSVPYKDKKLLTPEEKIKNKNIARHVESKISWALNTWLAPLRKLGLGRKIIAKQDFEFVELIPEPDKLSSSGFIYTPDQLKANNLLGNSDLMVIIGGVINYANPNRARELFSEPLSVPLYVYIRHDVGVTNITASKEWEYLLLHEIGHAFGLVDTYPDTVAADSPYSVSKLVDKLNALRQRGYVVSLRRGNTGIGYTLESLLGIDENNLKLPDLGGVELKSQRNGVSNRVTMFTFNRGAWKLKQRQLIETYGYVDTEGRPSLYCTVSIHPNNQGLFLRVKQNDIRLYQLDKTLIAEWHGEHLVSTFKKKMPALVMVYADTRTNSIRIEQKFMKLCFGEREKLM